MCILLRCLLASYPRPTVLSSMRQFSPPSLPSVFQFAFPFSSSLICLKQNCTLSEIYLPSMEVRRRNPETAKADRSTGSPPVEQQDVASTKNPLMERGLKLYEEAEQTGFQDENRLEKSLNYFVEAAENGADDAVEWISSFLSSMTALPPSVVLPESLVKAMQWLTEASESEKQVRAVAKSMFSKMAGRSGTRPGIPANGRETRYD